MNEGGQTFRDALDNTKKKILLFLKDLEVPVSTSTIYSNCGYGEDIDHVRKCLRELQREGKIEFEIRYVNSKYWIITKENEL